MINKDPVLLQTERKDWSQYERAVCLESMLGALCMINKDPVLLQTERKD